MVDVMDFISFLVKSAADTGIEKIKKDATTEVQKISETMKSSVRDGITQAVDLSMPILKKNGFILIGSAFLLFGIARLIDVIVKYDGTGFVIVGLIALLLSLFIRTEKYPIRYKEEKERYR